MLGAAAALASSLTWVVGSSVYSHLSKRVAPQTINFNRALIALPLFAITSIVQAGDVTTSLAALNDFELRSRVAWLVLSIAMSYGIGDVCFLWATRSLGYPTAQAIAATYPVWATLGGMLSGESVSLRRATGLALTVVGTVAVVLFGRASRKGLESPESPQSPQSPQKTYAVGVALALATSLFWALNGFSASRGGEGMNAAFANLIRMGFALGLTATFGRAQLGKNFRLFLARDEYVRFFPAFAIEAFLGSLLYVYGMSHATLAVGATLSSLAPVVAIPVAAVLGWERFSGRTFGAVLVVVLGVAVLLG